MSMINLLPDDYIARQRQRRSNVLCSILFAVVVAGVLAGAMVPEQRYRHTREVSERVNQAYADAEKMISQLKELEQTRQKLLSKGELTAGLLERVPRSYLLAIVTNALPRGSSLLRLDLKTTVRHVPVGGDGQKTRFDEVSGDAAKGVKTKSRIDVQIIVTGLAATDVEVGEFISAMQHNPLVARADLDSSEEKSFKEELVRQFRVTLYLKPNADVLVDEAEAKASLSRTGAFEANEIAGGVR